MAIYRPKPTTAHYMCTHCGQRTSKNAVSGRPNPGTCPKRPAIRGMKKPHVWVLERKS